jgi:hypothetical protein
MEGAMLTALVLVCSLALTPDLADCTHKNALDVMRVPEEFTNPVQCVIQAQAYVAQTAIGRRLNKDESVKIICAPIATVDKSRVRPLDVD